MSRAGDFIAVTLACVVALPGTVAQPRGEARDFDAVTAAVARVIAAERPAELQLSARGLEYHMWDGVALTALVVERTPELMRLPQQVVDAVAPFSVNGGTAEAIIDTPPDAEIVGYLEALVPKSSGTNYRPHVTSGFEGFTFKPNRVAICQLGNFGTAAKMLWQSKASGPAGPS